LPSPSPSPTASPTGSDMTVLAVIAGVVGGVLAVAVVFWAGNRLCRSSSRVKSRAVSSAPVSAVQLAQSENPDATASTSALKNMAGLPSA
jgi:energy-converting hydrogenase Eha subunit B